MNVVQNEYLVVLNALTVHVIWQTQGESWVSSANNFAIMDDGNIFCSFSMPGDNLKYHIVNSTNGNIIWSSSELALGFERWIGPDGKFYEGSAPTIL